MDGLNTILERRSCRVYQDKPVGEDVIHNLLKAGMYAPSAMNSQPWEFLVMQDAEKKEAASEIAPYWSMLKKAPLGILVLANTNGYRSKTTEFFVQDCASSTTCILLAAYAQGLGGVYLGLYPHEDRIRKLREIYNIPEHIIPFSIVSLGYPDCTSHPHTTFHEHKVHRDEY
jgi:nitroreductase